MPVRLFAILAAVAVCAGGAPSEYAALYRASQWFDLRDAVVREGSQCPRFYQGAVALAFHRPAEAGKHFAVLLRDAPSSWEAREARKLLATWYSFTGQYGRSLRVYAALAKLIENDAGIDPELRERRLWSRYAEPKIASRRHAHVRFTMKDGDIYLPVSVNGIEARYLIDTGANSSSITESEAVRLGLKVDEAPGLRAHDAAGASAGYRIAVAKELALGGFRLANVPLHVVPDSHMPFANLPTGSRGMLGLPVLYAWRTIRWNRDGVFEIGFRPRAYNWSAANLCFSGDGPHVLTRGEFAGRPADMVIDTGAMKSRLLPFFALAFQAAIQGKGYAATSRIVGMIGSRQTEVVQLPEAEFRIGGFRTVLRPAELAQDAGPFGSARYHLWLGSDLLQQASEVEIDFNSMQLVLR